MVRCAAAPVHNSVVVPRNRVGGRHSGGWCVPGRCLPAPGRCLVPLTKQRDGRVATWLPWPPAAIPRDPHRRSWRGAAVPFSVPPGFPEAVPSSDSPGWRVLHCSSRTSPARQVRRHRRLSGRGGVPALRNRQWMALRKTCCGCGVPAASPGFPPAPSSPGDPVR